MMETDKEKSIGTNTDPQETGCYSPSEKLFRDIGNISPDIIMEAAPDRSAAEAEASALPSHGKRKK